MRYTFSGTSRMEVPENVYYDLEKKLGKPMRWPQQPMGWNRDSSKEIMQQLIRKIN